MALRPPFHMQFRPRPDAPSCYAGLPTGSYRWEALPVASPLALGRLAILAVVH